MSITNTRSVFAGIIILSKREVPPFTLIAIGSMYIPSSQLKISTVLELEDNGIDAEVVIDLLVGL